MGFQTLSLGTNSGADGFKMQTFFAASWSDIAPSASEIQSKLVQEGVIRLIHIIYIFEYLNTSQFIKSQIEHNAFEYF